MKTETEPKQTAMQRLIEQLDLHIKTAYDRGNLMTVKAYEHSRALAHGLLHEERKVIEDAVEDTHTMNRTMMNVKSGTEYYQTKFKQ